MTRVYLAGPDVFLPDAVELGRRKVELCRRHGLIGLYPLDNAIDTAAPDASLQIFRGNVYELGYMAGRGKLCLGYTNDPSPYADRVRQSTQVTSRDGCLTDALGLIVEDFGLSDNLMMIHALDLHGFRLVTARQAPADIWHDLIGFEACVRIAAEHLVAPHAHRSS
jgi:nucleoside 2-deoxyribosyltransferase